MELAQVADLAKWFETGIIRIASLKLQDDLEILMKTARISPATNAGNWAPMPDPIRKEEVNIELTWTADDRTELAIRRQASLMGFATPSDYLTQTIATTLASNDKDIAITQDGRLVHKSHAHDSDIPPQEGQISEPAGS